MTRLLIEVSALKAAALTPPPSKSDAHRALTLGALLGQAPTLGGGTLPNDVEVLRAGLSALAADGPQRLECADGGAPFRILVTQAALRQSETTELVGTQRLGERPHAALLEALEQTLGPVGFSARWSGEPWPLVIQGMNAPAPVPRFEVAGSQSSQFATSLLLGAAALHLREGRTWEVILTGDAPSRGYLSLTERWLTQAGFELERSDARLAVTGFREAELPAVPGDWSSIGYLALIAWRSGGVVTSVSPDADHPDRTLLEILEQAGLDVRMESGTLRVLGLPKAGIQADAVRCPDLLPTLAALACVLPEPSRFENVSLLVAKESDRRQGMVDLARLAGAKTELSGDTLTILPGGAPPDALRFHSREDHRMAMAAATLAVLLQRPLTLDGAEHVSKSFPAFWQELRGSGIRLTELRG